MKNVAEFNFNLPWYLIFILLLSYVVLRQGLRRTSRVVHFNGRPVTDGAMEIYAHRAFRGLLPEQTMPAYIAALRLGVDYVDMDVGMTQDGVLVVTHNLDLNLDLTRDQHGVWITTSLPIHNLTFPALRQYNVGKLKPGTKYAAFFPQQQAKDAPIPALKEVVQYVKRVAGDRVGLQIEIKTDPEHPELTATPREFALALYKLIREEGIIDRTEIQAFDWRCLLELKQLDPRVKTAALSDSTMILPSGLWTAGLKPQDYGGSLPQMVKCLGADCWEPFEMELIKEMVEEAHILGLKVVPWSWPEKEGCEFNYERIEQLIAWGVDGFINDRSDIARGVLATRGYNLPQGFVI